MKIFLSVLLFLLICCGNVWALDCEDPSGKKMLAKACCGDYLELTFGSTSFSPYNPCDSKYLLIEDKDGNSFDCSYKWDPLSCTITLICDEIFGEGKFLYLNVWDSTMKLSELPSYSFIWISSTD